MTEIISYFEKATKQVVINLMENLKLIRTLSDIKHFLLWAVKLKFQFTKDFNTMFMINKM